MPLDEQLPYELHVDTAIPHADERPTATRTDNLQSSVTDENRWAILGALRFTLAILVVLIRVVAIGKLPITLDQLDLLGADYAPLCFFAISGFSIAHSILSRPNGFLQRRLDRIYPLYLFAMLLAMVPLALSIKEAPDNPLQLVAQFIFLQGFIAPPLESNVDIWTMSCQMSYYLLAILFQKPRIRLLYPLLIISAIFMAVRHYFHLDDISNSMYGLPAICLLWSWILGYIACADRSLRSTVPLVIGLGSFLTTFYGDPHIPHGVLLWAITGSALLFPCPNFAAYVRKTMLALGEVSWPIYILHMPILLLLSHYMPNQSGITYLTATLTCAVLVNYAIDRPIRIWLTVRRINGR
jgi:peptidoglycan/LPS O-acetylase OafA/YrhL